MVRLCCIFTPSDRHGALTPFYIFHICSFIRYFLNCVNSSRRNISSLSRGPKWVKSGFITENLCGPKSQEWPIHPQTGFAFLYVSVPPQTMVLLPPVLSVEKSVSLIRAGTARFAPGLCPKHCLCLFLWLQPDDQKLYCNENGNSDRRCSCFHFTTWHWSAPQTTKSRYVLSARKGKAIICFTKRVLFVNNQMGAESARCQWTHVLPGQTMKAASVLIWDSQLQNWGENGDLCVHLLK